MHTIFKKIIIIAAIVVLCLFVPLLVGTQQTAFAQEASNGKIAFESNRDGNYEIYVMNADSSNQTNLSNHPGNDYEPVWSPDGSKIAFFSDRNGTFEIYVMNADGSNQIRLTNNPAWDKFPMWSPDGSQIAFISSRVADGALFIMNADGSNQTQLTFGISPLIASWSPDGSQFVYQSLFGGNDEIFVINADGTNPINISNQPGGDSGPQWSPDGTQIVFGSQRVGGGGDYDIYVMDADGSNPTRLTNDTDWDYYPTWSPEGNQILFHSTRDGDDEIYVMNSNGSDITPLTNNSASDRAPDWYGPTTSTTNGCLVNAPETTYQYNTFTLTLDCASITADVFGFQAGHTITTGDTLVTAQASVYTAGTVFHGQATLTGENTLPVYALSLQAGGTEATGDFTLGSVDYGADFPGDVTFDLANLILGDRLGDVIPNTQASPSTATITIIDVVDSLSGVVDPEGHALDTELVFALEGDPTIGPIDTTYNPDGTTNFTIHDIHGHPAYLDVDAPSHLTCQETLSLSGDETDITLPADLILRAGDVNDDETIDITDATAIGQQYGQPASGELDINDDGTINILDLIHVGRNYSGNGPTECSP